MVWSPPSPSMIKVNADARMEASAGTASLGAIARDANGEVVFSGVTSLNCRIDVILAEAMAIRFGVKLACQKGLRRFHLESDSKLAAKHVHRGEGTNSVIMDTGDEAMSCEICIFSHVKKGS
ncbi:hypothetical protein DITRI_Ditri15bG0083500 [Diplodiscus trichospermus]